MTEGGSQTCPSNRDGHRIPAAQRGTGGGKSKAWNRESCREGETDHVNYASEDETREGDDGAVW